MTADPGSLSAWPRRLAELVVTEQPSDGEAWALCEVLQGIRQIGHGTILLYVQDSEPDRIVVSESKRRS